MNNNFSIIIIDNDASQAELIELQLRKASIAFSHVRVGSKEMFFATVRDRKPDLVIASTNVPKFDMLDTLGEAKKTLPGVPWIMVGASGNEELAVSMMKGGASDFVGKKNIVRIGPAAKALLERRKKPPEESDLLNEPGEPQPQEKGDVLFHQLAESAPDLIAVINPEGRRLYNNPAYNDILDEPETLAGTDSFVDIHPEDRERIRRGFQETLATGVGLQTEYRLMDKEGNTRYIESHSSVISDAEGRPDKVVVISRDVTERIVSQKGLEDLIAGTAGVAGEKFFPALVRHLAEALGTHYALVSEVVGERRERVRSIAYCADGALQPVFEYDVADTTCERVVKNGETVCYPDRVQQLFPKETALAAMHAESYLGTPLLGSSGQPIGHLFVMDHDALEDIPRKESILKVFAQRAALELERMHLTEEPRRREASWKTMEARFRSGLEGMNAAIVMTDESDLITLVSGKTEELTGYRAAELLGRHPWPLILGSGAWELLKEEYQDTLCRNDKSTIPVSVYAVPCRNPEGRISGTLALLNPEKSMESVAPPVAPAGEQLALLDRIGVGLIVRDLEDRIIFWNAGAQQLYGWTSGEAFGKTVTGLLYGRHPGAGCLDG
jgi:PAS domain S-box-containing protein